MKTLFQIFPYRLFLTCIDVRLLSSVGRFSSCQNVIVAFSLYFLHLRLVTSLPPILSCKARWDEAPNILSRLFYIFHRMILDMIPSLGMTEDGVPGAAGKAADMSQIVVPNAAGKAAGKTAEALRGAAGMAVVAPTTQQLLWAGRRHQDACL